MRVRLTTSPRRSSAAATRANLIFVALVPMAYAAFVQWGGREHGFKLWQVIAFDGVYAAYLAVMLIGVLKVI